MTGRVLIKIRVDRCFRGVFDEVWTGKIGKSLTEIDRLMLDRQLAEGGGAMASQEEFVLMHIDGIEATGFVEHLKLPHYVEFQSILQGMRRRRDRHAATTTEREAALV